MKKSSNYFQLGFALILPLILILSSCGGGAEDDKTTEETFRAAYDDYRMMDDPEEKADLMDRFVRAHPDSPAAGRAIAMVVYNRYASKEAYGEALAYLDNRLAVIDSQEVKRNVNLQKLEILARLKNQSEFTELAGQLINSPEGLTPNQQQQILDAAVEAGSWNLALELAESVLEAFPADDDPYGRSSILMKEAWSMHNLGRSRESLEIFSSAAELAPRNFAGYFEYPAMELEYQWSQALLGADKPKDALARFEPRALFVREEDKELQRSYQSFFRELYLASGNLEASLNEYRKVRKEDLSRRVPDFSSLDREGILRKFSEIKGERATLLIFWFPT